LGDFGLAIKIVDLKKPSEHNWKSIGKPMRGIHKKNMVGNLLYLALKFLKKYVQFEKFNAYGFGIMIKWGFFFFKCQKWWISSIMFEFGNILKF
jgi:hypothetical protein